MKNLFVIVGLTLALGACARTDAFDDAKGTDIAVQKQDGVTVEGRLVEVNADQIVLEKRDGARTTMRRSDVQTFHALRATTPPAGAAGETKDTARAEAPVERDGRDPSRPDTGRVAQPPATALSDGSAVADRDAGARAAREADRAPEYREVTVPAGTSLAVELQTAVGSDTSSVEDPVRATLRRAVTVDGVQVLPAGTLVTGHVTSAQRSARVKGRGRVAFRFTQIDPPGSGGRSDLRTATITRVAPATKKQDAAKIGGGAVGGAIVGGILGGGGGAAKGAAIGGGAGTAVVMSTRGKEIRLGPGAPLTLTLTGPFTVRVLQKK